MKIIKQIKDIILINDLIFKTFIFYNSFPCFFKISFRKIYFLCNNFENNRHIETYNKLKYNKKKLVILNINILK